MIKAIFWDLDGTILDFIAAEKAAIRKCFEITGMGECSDEMIARYSVINVKYWEALERGEMTKPQILVGRFREFFRTYGLDESRAEEFNSHYQIRLGDTIVFQPHALETIKALSGKYLQCCVTNGTLTAQTRKFHGSGLDRIFEYIFISEEIGIEKPDKAFFDRAFDIINSGRVTPLGVLAAEGCSAGVSESGKASGSDCAAAYGSVSACPAASVHVDPCRLPCRLPLLPSEVMIVGDSLTSDIRGGNNAGLITCRYNPDGRPNDQGVRIDYDIRDLAELPGLIV